MRRSSAYPIAAPLVMAVSLALASPVLMAQDAASRVQLEMQVQSLSAAINQLTRSARVQLLADPGLLAGKQAPALSGHYTVREALDRLLAGSGIGYRFVDAGTIALQAEEAARRQAPPPPQSSSSQQDDPVDLQRLDVTGRVVKPDYMSNADLPRSINDVQAYYFFDADALEASGAATVEQFLKQRLSMNGATASFSQISGNARGNASAINLRGMGQQNTLVLVNGRRLAGATTFDETYQADLNGIPIAAIDHIEVLPSSAAGIYGSEAMGGVVNIVLKKNYSGGEVTVSFEDPQDSGASIRQIQAIFGTSLQQGRSHLTMSVVKRDTNSLLVGDRMDELGRNYDRIRQNNPDFLGSPSNPWLSSTPNIGRADGSSLLLKDGTSLGSSITHISPGFAPGTSAAALNAMLLANAGNFNLDYAPTTSQRGGLLLPMQKEADDVSFMANFRISLTDNIQAFIDFSQSNSRVFDYSASQLVVTVPEDAPSNPFAHDVRVSVPGQGFPYEIYTKNRNINLGMVAELPKRWSLAGDFTYTAADYGAQTRFAGTWLMNDAIGVGSFNPFSDVLAYDQDYAGCCTYLYDRGGELRRTITREFSARANGPVFKLPAGEVLLNAAVTHRKMEAGTGIERYSWVNAWGESEVERYDFIPAGTTIKSAYLEAKVPLLRSDALFAKELELQLSVRTERYTQNLGSYTYYTYSIDGEVDFAEWYPGDENGDQVVAETTWSSTNPTIGFKWRPFDSLMFRASYAEAFVPLGQWYLQPDPFRPDDANVTIFDPAMPEGQQTYQVATWTGGNPTNMPSTAESWNFGLVWEPQGVLEGLRVGLERYRLIQNGVVGEIPLDTIIAGENGEYADRVHRDPATGRITWIDHRYANLFKRETRGYDLKVNYRLNTEDYGTLSLDFIGTHIDSLTRQESFDGPMLEYVNRIEFLSFNDTGGALRNRGTLALSWQLSDWLFNWTTRYYGSYIVRNAEGSPVGYNPIYTLAQGSSKISSQTYHDAMITYAFNEPAWTWLEGVNLQLGIKNVFDKVPPMDVGSRCYGYYSCFGDMRLRTFYLGVRKTF